MFGYRWLFKRPSSCLQKVMNWSTLDLKTRGSCLIFIPCPRRFVLVLPFCRSFAFGLIVCAPSRPLWPLTTNLLFYFCQNIYCQRNLGAHPYSRGSIFSSNRKPVYSVCKLVVCVWLLGDRGCYRLLNYCTVFCVLPAVGVVLCGDHISFAHYTLLDYFSTTWKHPPNFIPSKR